LILPHPTCQQPPSRRAGFLAMRCSCRARFVGQFLPGRVLLPWRNNPFCDCQRDIITRLTEIQTSEVFTHI
jgi:hypothetical protein